LHAVSHPVYLISELNLLQPCGLRPAVPHAYA
jgi:hypothetical protein